MDPVFPSRFLDLVGPRLSDDQLLGYVDGGALGHSPEVHRWARAALLEGWPMARPGEEPTLEALQAIQSLAAHDGQYGRGWPDHASPITGYQTSMSSCNNWGAIQCTNCKPVDGQCCEGCGYWYDSRPTDAGQVQFEQCFKCYSTPAEGAADVLRFLSHYPKVIAALPSGNLDEIAWQMRLGNYFQGFTTDKREAARQYAEAMRKQAVAIADAMGEPLAADRKGEGVSVGGLSLGAGVPWRAVGLGLLAGAAGVAIVAGPGAILGPLAALGGVLEGGATRARRAVGF